MPRRSHSRRGNCCAAGRAIKSARKGDAAVKRSRTYPNARAKVRTEASGISIADGAVLEERRLQPRICVLRLWGNAGRGNHGACRDPPCRDISRGEAERRFARFVDAFQIVSLRFSKSSIGPMSTTWVDSRHSWFRSRGCPMSSNTASCPRFIRLRRRSNCPRFPGNGKKLASVRKIPRRRLLRTIRFWRFRQGIRIAYVAPGGGCDAERRRLRRSDRAGHDL